MGDGNFAPTTNITREQMAVMLLRYADAVGVHIPMNNAPMPFADQQQIAGWAQEAVSIVQAAGIVSGRPDGRFDPQATATRAEVAAIFARFMHVTGQ